MEVLRATPISPVVVKVCFVQVRNCLVNLPFHLTDALATADTPPQNVIVELRIPPTVRAQRKLQKEETSRSFFLGWTGFASQASSASLGQDMSPRRGERNIGTVEIDASYAALLGLSNGQDIGVLVHKDPPGAKLVDIEPSTEEDWEIIELHASFLEVNLHSQVRALPNPEYGEKRTQEAWHRHPLMLHLSPTMTANVTVVSLTPPVPPNKPFAKLLPSAEVSIAPKVRAGKTTEKQSESKEPIGAATAGIGPPLSGQSRPDKVAWFLSIDITSYPNYQTQLSNHFRDGLAILLSTDALENTGLTGCEWVTVSTDDHSRTPLPAEAKPGQNSREITHGGTLSRSPKVVARLLVWDSPSDPWHSLLSGPLCACLGVKGMVCGMVAVERAPPALPQQAVKGLGLYPFRDSGSQRSQPVKVGKSLKDLRAALGDMIREQQNLLSGPLTDGLILALPTSAPSNEWVGIMVRLEVATKSADRSEDRLQWFINEGCTKAIELRVETSLSAKGNELRPTMWQSVLEKPAQLAGLGESLKLAVAWLTQGSSTLVTGTAGSGKTAFARLVGYVLRLEHHAHLIFGDCKKLAAGEARVASVKETLDRMFLETMKIAQLGGFSLMILDDLDELCTAESELQVGQDNGRSRQIGELFSNAMRLNCSASSRTVVLATASTKDNLQAAVSSGGIFDESLVLKAPNKNQRVEIISMLTSQSDDSLSPSNSLHQNGDAIEDVPVRNRSEIRPQRISAYLSHEGLDLLEIASRADGFMPGDLSLLAERARGEMLIRMSASTQAADARLQNTDFWKALENFIPASLRNLPLTSSTGKFASVGGLRETRAILLETFQYPVTYAPVFAQCPLRLRSGILLYGYPGCGKTLLANAIAGECGLNFISVKGPEILNKYIGASEKSVRDLFERAEAAKPCVLFFDEFDSLAPKRGHDSTGVTDRVVNQLLTQLDGAEGLSGVYVLAATSRPDLIDPALLRPGRLDKSLLCDLPSTSERAEILQVLAQDLEIDSKAGASLGSHASVFKELAQRTEGFTGADLQSVIYDAHLNAIQETLKHQNRTQETEIETTHADEPREAPSETLFAFKFGEAEQGALNANRVRLPEGGQVHTGSKGKHPAAFKRFTGTTPFFEHVNTSKRGHGQKTRRTFASDDLNARKIGDAARVIRWRHLEAALAETRRSISDMDRKRLRSIYSDFVKSRSGEMPSGQGSTEVGARSSLM